MFRIKESRSIDSKKGFNIRSVTRQIIKRFIHVCAWFGSTLSRRNEEMFEMKTLLRLLCFARCLSVVTLMVIPVAANAQTAPAKNELVYLY